MSFAPKNDNTTTYECDNCGYLMVTESGRPVKCLSCGRERFSIVDNKKVNRRDDDINSFSRELNNLSGKQLLYYAVLALAFVGSMIGILILILI